MKTTLTLITGLALATLLAPSTHAESHLDPAIAGALKARQAQMDLYAFNLGLLGDMAKGALPYDAASATLAANNLATLSQLDQSRLWPEGSDNFELDDATEALPMIWQDSAQFATKQQNLIDAAIAMQAVAGQGLDPLKGAMSQLGGACGGCHKVNRQKN